MADLSIVGMLSPTAAPYFGWDLVRDVQELLRYAFMQHAFEVTAKGRSLLRKHAKLRVKVTATGASARTVTLKR